VPKPYPEEFRQDLVRGARNRGPGVTVEQVPPTSKFIRLCQLIVCTNCTRTNVLSEPGRGSWITARAA